MGGRKCNTATTKNKTFGDDEITADLIQAYMENEEFKVRFFNLLEACVKLDYHLKNWQQIIVVRITQGSPIFNSTTVFYYIHYSFGE